MAAEPVGVDDPDVGAVDPDVMTDDPEVMGDEDGAADELRGADAELLAELELLAGLELLPAAAVVLLEPQAVAARASTANPAITPDLLKVLRVVTTRTSSSSGHRLLAERHSRT